MAPKNSSTSRRIRKPCAVCGEVLLAHAKESQYERAFTCQTQTADISDGLKNGCLLQLKKDSDNLRSAIAALSIVSKRNHGAHEKPAAEKRMRILKDYITEVGSGEPPIQWYRDKLKLVGARHIHNALKSLPYWDTEKIRFNNLTGIGPIDKRVRRLRSDTNDSFADLLVNYIDYHYELMEFGVEHDLYGDANPVRLSTLSQRIFKLSAYLEWLFKEGHETLQNAGRSVLDEYITEKGLHPGAIYQIAKFYTWARKKYRFTPSINFSRRGRGKYRTEFNVLKLKESQEIYKKICSHPEPRGRALALLALLYAQQTKVSLLLKRTDLERDLQTGLWIIARPNSEPFAIEPELSEALDECIEQAENNKRTKESVYVFPSPVKGCISDATGRKLIREASGVKGNILRRTSVVNMYRGGQKTMGTVVLRDVLNVSSPTLHQAIRMTGESINSPIAIEEADALRHAFLDDED